MLALASVHSRTVLPDKPLTFYGWKITGKFAELELSATVNYFKTQDKIIQNVIHEIYVKTERTIRAALET